jgi:uncharacterized protein (TIGR04141 family)
VKHDPELIAALDLALDTAIGAPTGKRIGLAWPHEQTEENRPAVGYRVLGLGRGKAGPFDDLPTLDDLIGLASSESAGKRVERLRKLRIQLLSEPDCDDTVVASSAIPATKWIAFETDHDGRRYFLHNGSWYLMDQDYAERLKAQTKVILSRSPGFIMPDWPASINREEDYNKQAASVLGGLVLDQKLAYTTLHRRGIELCDLLLSDGTLVHVKKLRRSDAASHQIAQALVSSDALLYDEDARTKFGAVIGKAGGGAEWKPKQLKKVVLAMARPGPLTEDTLFTFTQVTLVRSVTALQERGVEVFVAPIQLTP